MPLFHNSRVTYERIISSDNANAIIDSLEFSNDNRLRLNAVEALSRISDKRVITPLIIALKDQNSDVRLGASKALVEINDISATDELITCLNDRDPSVRYNVVDVLEKIGDSKVKDSLINIVLTDPDQYLRFKIVKVLTQMDKEDIINRFIIALNDVNYTVRKNAANALGLMLKNSPNPKASNALIATLKDTASFVRQQAIISIGEIGGSGSVEPLIACLEDRETDVKITAVEALGKIAEDRTIDALVNIALKDNNSTVRWITVDVLGKLTDGKSKEGLIGILNDRNVSVREHAAEMLGLRGCVEAEEILINMLKHDVQTRRLMAAKALERIGSANAINVLIRTALKDEDPNVRETAISAFKKMNDRKIINVLIFISINDNDQKLREMAVDSLKIIDEDKIVEVLTAAFTNYKDNKTK